MAEKVFIVSQSHLCRNPRVIKEARILAAANYKITILTAIYSEELYREDQSLLSGTGITYKIYSDLRLRNLQSIKARLVKKLAFYAQMLGFESLYSLGYEVLRLKKIIRSQKADLYIMHQELATVIGGRMVKKCKVAFDFEDWYSEDLLPESRKKRPIKLLKRAEKVAIEKGAVCYTTSQVMARGLQVYYKTLKRPAVIYNSFDAANNIVESQKDDSLHLYWLSQTIGKGRGLEFFITCMAQSRTRCKLSLRGNIDDEYKTSLQKMLSSKDSIEFLPMLKNAEIQTNMSRYDSGLALEPDTPINKDLTISNKLFHYMAAGLPVIASDTQGQAEIAAQCPELIFLYRQNQAEELIHILNQLGAKKQTGELTNIKKQMLEFYRSTFAWPIEASKLVNLINDVFETAG